MQLNGELHAGGPGANDADPEFARRAFRDLHRTLEEALLEGAGLVPVVQHVAVLHHALDAKVINLRADRQDERVVGNFPRTHEVAGSAGYTGDRYRLGGDIETVERAHLETEVIGLA